MNSHGCTLIQNNSDLYINGTVLWNSIYKSEKININRKGCIKEFLSSNYMQSLYSGFNELCGDIPNYKEESDTIYIHHILLHFIIKYLGFKYANIVSKLAYYRFKSDDNKTDEVEYDKKYAKLFHHINDVYILAYILELIDI